MNTQNALQLVNVMGVSSKCFCPHSLACKEAPSHQPPSLLPNTMCTHASRNREFHLSFDTVYADFVVNNVLGNEWESTQIIMSTKLRVQAVGR